MCHGAHTITPIPRADECFRCGQRMLYHVNEVGVADSMRCHNLDCEEWGHEVLVVHVDAR